MKSLDPHKPVTMVFCCVDPSQYSNSFDIGQTFTITFVNVFTYLETFSLCFLFETIRIDLMS